VIGISDRTDRRLYLLVGLVVLLGTVSILVATLVALGEAIHGVSQAPILVFAAVALMVAVADLINVEVRIGSHRHGITWADAAVLIGLAILPVHWVVLATAVGITVSEAVRRRRPVKFAFAVAKESTTAAFAGMTLLVFDVGVPIGAPTEVAQLGVAFLIITILDPLLTVPVVALSSRTPVLSRLKSNWDIRLLMAAGRFTVVVLAVLALQAAPELLYALPVVVLIAHLWHERWVRTRQERQAWQHLAAATEKFTGVDLDEVVHAAVTGGAKLFSADEIEVELWLGLDRRLVRGTSSEVTFDGDPADATVDDMNVYAVALHGYAGRRDIGALRLRFRGEVNMSDREEAMLNSYAAALDTAIRNAVAYGHLGQASRVHAHAAAHDPLTGLANRRELERLLNEALADPRAAECHIALLMVDLKHFKEVNDALGHRTGDEVLARIAARLAASVGEYDTATRFGGDEFAVLLRHAHDPARVRQHAEQTLSRLTEPIEIDGLPLVIEANAGLALAVDPAQAGDDDPDRDSHSHRDRSSGGGSALADTPADWAAELMRRADVAMYQAKRTAQRLVCYSHAGDTADRDRLSLAGRLPKAVSQREFVLHFQPIVDLATGEVHGAEALARWRHPTRGQLEPRLFLDLLERSNQLGEFTAAVLDDALSARNTWRAGGHDLSVSVNISARSLLDTGLPRMVLETLDAHGTRPDRLCLELTETLAISQVETVDRVLTQLHDIGVRLALDDFGTGHSSLAVLARIPVHQLKIDREFVHTLREPWLADEADHVRPDGDATATEDDDDSPDAEAVHQARAVVRSTVQLGKALDLAVVAEGIENHAQRQLLWQFGCTLGQGHLFARPLAADQLLSYLTRGVGGRPGRLAASVHDGDNIVHLGAGRRGPPRPRGVPGPRGTSGS
jgi:diguanylate cyclase